MGQRDEKYLLSGIVELDDGYVGGPSHNGKRGRGTDKAKIVVAVSKAQSRKWGASVCQNEGGGKCAGKDFAGDY